MYNVELKNVSKRYGEVEVINDLSLKVEEGTFTALLGPSGCGKSTLLRMIAGLEEITKGQCFIGDVDVTNTPPGAARHRDGVPELCALSASDGARRTSPSRCRWRVRRKASAGQARAPKSPRMLQLEQLLDRRPAQLSGGQRQRVAIGRALVREPKVFLFDEPLSNLDALLRVQMRLELAKLHQDLGTTMIYVTHDQVEAMTLADRIVVLDKGDISQVGSPLELYNRPANRFVASFIGSPAMNFIDADVAGRTGNNVDLTLPGGGKLSIAPRGTTAPKGSKLTLGVRPEHLHLGTAGGASIDGKVRIVEQLGNSTLVYVDTAAGELIVEAEGSFPVKTGDAIGVTVDPAKSHLFDSNELVICPALWPRGVSAQDDVLIVIAEAAAEDVYTARILGILLHPDAQPDRVVGGDVEVLERDRRNLDAIDIGAVARDAPGLEHAILAAAQASTSPAYRHRAGRR